jgi:hypothetical protein
MFSDGIYLVFSRPYGTLWFDSWETGNELPAYYQLPLRGIYRQPEWFLILFPSLSLFNPSEMLFLLEL